jgi:phospholipid-binding lipoprotein MlaA
MLRFFGGISSRAVWRASAAGVAALALASFIAPEAEAGARRDNQTLEDLQKAKAARLARLTTSTQPGEALPIVITPASVTEQVEPIAPADDAATKQATTQEVAATAEDGVEDFPSVNDDISVDDIQVPSDLTEEIPDPMEPVNRFFFGINEGLDFLIVRPVAIVYRTAVPKPVRIGIGNALRNAATPIILANDILQGAEGKRVEATMVRFMLNSTLGIGGLIDVGSYVGLEFHREDFGQTLAVWGVGPGPYMVAPIFGPGNPRDFIGVVVDTAINPMTWILADEQFYVRVAPSVAEMISTREIALDDVDSLRKTSPDFYVTVRQLYNEKRTTDIANGDVTLTPIPGMRSIPPSNLTPVVNPF